MKNQKPTHKTNKGITLIALIITIVVLLILAIVTIGAVQDSGIIGHAKNASSKYTIAQEKEEINVALGEWQIEKNIPTKTAIFKDVMETALSEKAKVEGGDNGPLTITMNKTGNQYTVTDSGEIITAQKGISISPANLSLALQGTRKLTATLTGGLKEENIVYSSSDESVVIVNENGEVTGVALGEATITAECEGYSSTCKVTVRDVSLLEQYILGADLSGRDFTQIMDMDNMVFKDEESTISDASTSMSLATTRPEDDLNNIIAYTKYNNDTYKFKILTEEGVDENGDETYSYTTVADYGVIKIEVEGEKAGKTVKYDNKIWTILYDDNTNGLQMISNQSLLYNDNRFYLGYNDSLITSWDSLITAADLDNSGDLNYFEKAVYSYNHAIDTLNTACESLVTPNSNITDVRSVGSNPTNKSAENTTLYTSDFLAEYPKNNSTYAAGIGNERGKSTDQNYVSDFDRMVALGVNVGYNSAGEGLGYWLASRFVDVDSDDVDFRMRSVYSDGDFGAYILWYVSESHAYGNYNGYALRPVVSLSSNIQLVADTTGEADYTF